MMVDERAPEDEFDDGYDPLDPASRAANAKEEAERRVTASDQAAAFLRDRRDAYMRAFTSEDGKIVLADIRWFCRLDSTPWDADPRIHALMTGRYEVGRRILDHIDLTFDQLVEKYMRKPGVPE